MIRCRFLLPLLVALPLAAQNPPATTLTQLTIYNEDFAVARTTIPLNLHAGANEVLTTNVTSQLEPDSVVLRDPTGRNPINVAEQNYDAAVVNQQWMLEKYEGKTIEFQIQAESQFATEEGKISDFPAKFVQGRILRAGNQSIGDQPLVEVNGKMQFQLPGTPVFPANTHGLLLKPTLRWKIDSSKAASFPAELDYITKGMSWQATYNVVLPETTDTTAAEQADLVGWVTIKNDSGTDFPRVTIQLMAGDVAKIRDMYPRTIRAGGYGVPGGVVGGFGSAPTPTEKPFDDFHLYDLHRTLALHNGEIKQVQFLEASRVSVQRTYQYEGNNPVVQIFYPGYHNEQPILIDSINTHVAAVEEISNSTANHLGMPLPAGRLRLYRKDTGGQMQFVGESMIHHTPAEQNVKLVSGNAFDITAHRRQTDFHVDSFGHFIDESFEIKLSNQKAQPVTVHAVEHMYRCENWEITAKSSNFIKRDSSTIDFPIPVPAKGDATLTYTVHYTW
jgi:hypothetical protein